jgi:hypothetical protein
MDEDPRPLPGMPVPRPAVAEGKPNGTSIFHAVDPLGNEIVLDIDTWENHIIRRHPEMQKFQDLLPSVIKNPALIQRSPDEPSTCFYYQLTGRTFYRAQDVYISVVVDLPVGEKVGRVKTTHIVKTAGRPNGETLWLKP